jgi:uncharacterized protein
MIRSTFQILEKIGPGTEKSIWEQGIRTWDDFLLAKKINSISDHKKYYFDRKIEEARKQLYTFNSAYFTQKIPSTSQWRLYEFFKEDCVFIDIEASGVNDPGFITVIGLYDGIRTKTMVKGINLDFSKLKKELEKYKMIVSFNGLSYDIPLLEKSYPGLFPNIPHFDLKHACQRLGMKGGLKQVEKQLGIERRNRIVERMYGGDPITLWRMYRATGDEHYLELLVEYNEEDIINLKPIANHVYNKLVKETLGSQRESTISCKSCHGGQDHKKPLSSLA